MLADPDQRLAITDGALPEVTGGTAVSLVGDPDGRGLAVLEPGAAIGRALTEVDVVFPVLHGAYGEDGTIQGLLEMAGLPYVGSGVFASAASMDKEFTKKLLAAAGLPQGDHVVLRDAAGAVCADPGRAGRGGARAAGPAGLREAVAGRARASASPRSPTGRSSPRPWPTAAAVDPKVIVEASVPGREIECGVLAARGGGLPEASLPAEIRLRPGVDWYDFSAKYLDDSVDFDVPADLTPEQTAAVQEAARRAYLALDCRGPGAGRLLPRHRTRRHATGWSSTRSTRCRGSRRSRCSRGCGRPAGSSYPELVDRLVATALDGGSRTAR